MLVTLLVVLTVLVFMFLSILYGIAYLVKTLEEFEEVSSD